MFPYARADITACTGEWSVKTASLRAALALSAAGRVFLRLTERSVKSRGELALPEICKPLVAWLALLLKASNFSTKKCLFKYKILTVVKWHFQLSQWNQIISQQSDAKLKIIATWSLAFPCALRSFLVYTWSSQWPVTELTFVLIWFGFRHLIENCSIVEGKFISVFSIYICLYF